MSTSTTGQPMLKRVSKPSANPSKEAKLAALRLRVTRSTQLILPIPSGTSSVAAVPQKILVELEALPIQDSSFANNEVLAVVRKMLEFADLEPNWDSYGGKPVALKTVQKAERLFSQIVERFSFTHEGKICPFDVAPRSDGGVQFEWRSEKNALEVEVYPGQGYGYLLILGEGESRKFEEGDNATISDILTLFSRIIG